MRAGDRDASQAAAAIPWRAFAADALRYWEPRRAIYNAALALVVGRHLATYWPDSVARLPDVALFLFFLAVLANVLYCVAYAVDLFVQLAGLMRAWPWLRPTVLVIGTAFAGVLAHYLSAGLFAPPID